MPAQAKEHDAKEELTLADKPALELPSAYFAPALRAQPSVFSFEHGLHLVLADLPLRNRVPPGTRRRRRFGLAAMHPADEQDTG
jgi:hypothetical protein